MMEWALNDSIFIKLLLSAGLGAIIGLERELKQKPVGLKTSIVLSVVSCLLTIVSVESVYLYEANSEINITMDPLRLAAQIVSGVGFIGAGVILHRTNDSISGLTTAAMVWGAAGIGIVVGAGFYAAAIAGVLMILLAVEILPSIVSFIGPGRLQERNLYIRIRTSGFTYIQEIIKAVEKEGISIYDLRILYDAKSESHLIELTAGVYFKRNITDIYCMLSEIPHVQSLDVEGR